MSDELETAVEEVEVGNEALEVGGEEEISEAPARAYLDPSQFADHYVKVKVDGEEVELPIQDALSGVMMQQSYTRKTQALAAERQRLQEYASLAAALERDPAGTLQVLQQVYGVGGTDPAELDPEEARIVQLERFVAEAQERERQAMIDRQFESLHSKYGDFDERELIEFAVQNGIGNVEAAYRVMHFDRLHEIAQAEAKRKAEEAAKVEAKRQAQIVSGGSNPQAGSNSGQVAQTRSVREAFLAAKKTLGMS